MEKASKAIRRSGVRLKSLSSGHGDIQMIISQLGDVRTSFKTFAIAQAQASEDAHKWAGSHENRAIGETFTYLAELSVLWSDVQKEFAEQLKEYKSLYELILEGERHVTQARETLVAREQREGKLRKEYKKANKKAPPEEVCILKERLNQAERSRDLAHLELVERVSENEAVKMIRVKEGLLKISAAYCELAQKCMVIFSAQENVTAELPDVQDKDLHDVKYTGSEAARKFVLEAKEQVRSYRRNSISKKPPAPSHDDPPPPYTPSLEHLNDLSNSRQNGFIGNSHAIPSNINNSSLNHPSAPKVSMPSINNDHPLPNGVGSHVSPNNRNGPLNQPTAPAVSSSTINSHPGPKSPPSHIYPELPQPPKESPQLPHPLPPPPPPNVDTVAAGPPPPPDQQPVAHFQSVPNLGDGSSFDHGLKYCPLNVGENTSFNDSSFHPDTSSSSPNLLCSRLPKTSTPANSPPFNPYYDWLPAHSSDKQNNTESEESRNESASSPKSDTPQQNEKIQQPDSGTKSVRPKTNTNPFLDDSTDDDTPGNTSSGAVKKSTVM